MMVSTGIVRKGERLYQDHRVLGRVNHLGHEYVTVAGDHDVYLVRLYLDGRIPVEAEHWCTCPAHVLCSHVVAALFDYLDDTGTGYVHG
jgi:uncharacterized Zn finger protein